MTPCQGVPSLSRKVIVKNITPSDASQIAFSYRVALDSAFPVEQVAGRSVFFKKNKITTLSGALLIADNHLFFRSLLAVAIGVTSTWAQGTSKFLPHETSFN